MKKSVKNILIPVLVLMIIALVSGLLLSIVNEFTTITDEELEARTIKKINEVYECSEGFEKVEYQASLNEEVNGNIKYFYKAKDDKGTFVVVATGGGGYGGEVEMYTVFQGKEIIKIAKGVNGETPGVSDNALSENYFERFYGIDVTQIDGFVLNGTEDNSVDGVSGATFSSTGVLNAVSNASKYYKEYFMEVLA